VVVLSLAKLTRESAARTAACLSVGPAVHNMCMKRTNLVLREDLLLEAARLSGEKTWSATVDRALEEFVRRFKARQILDLRGSGLWEGSLADMRDDRRTKRRRG
jgi:hypothetical protein